MTMTPRQQALREALSLIAAAVPMTPGETAKVSGILTRLYEQASRHGAGVDPSLDYTSSTLAVLGDVLQLAQDLCEPGNGEHNPEYERGQAELICSLFGLPTDYYRDAILTEIAGS